MTRYLAPSTGRTPADASSSAGGARVDGLQLGVSGLALAAVGAASSVGLVALTLVDVLVLVGVGLVLPLALVGRWRWTVAALAVAASLCLGTGWAAAVLALPWFVVAAWAGVVGLRARPPRDQWLRWAATLVAAGYGAVGAVAFASSRLGVSLFGIGEPIVELTAVHFTYAGCGALVLATRNLDAPGAWRRAAALATVLTAAGPVVVATGFVTGLAVPQVGGAVLLTIGVWFTAGLEGRSAVVGRGRAGSRLLLAVSALAIWIPMVLAVAWAAGQHWDVPALSIPDMARTHGVANALAFVLCGLLARWSAPPLASPVAPPTPAGGPRRLRPEGRS